MCEFPRVQTFQQVQHLVCVTAGTEHDEHMCGFTSFPPRSWAAKSCLWKDSEEAESSDNDEDAEKYKQDELWRCHGEISSRNRLVLAFSQSVT